MKGKKLIILYKDTNGEEKVRCSVDKWTFQDKAMSVGGQYITFDIFSEIPISFAIGDYCVYRGQSFYLNILPSVTQTAKPKKTGDTFKYNSVRLDGVSGDLGRVIMLDITPTTGDYIAAVGTNYTGSSNFQLFCGETKAMVLGKEVVYTPVCTLAGKIQANLDRVFPKDGWHIYVNLKTTHKVGVRDVYDTHTDDKVLTFNNTTVAVALSEVQNTFKLDYFIKGRDIYIGYTLGAITGDNTVINENSADNNYFYFGYGKGYADENNQGKALFEIKKTANSSQQVITRLRAMGSTKNIPYRYYNKKYNLPQSLFPQNLQLPDTFEIPTVKEKRNQERKVLYPYLRAVLGDTNDAYIDKNDDCMSSIEGLREGVGLWDGSNQDLEEIYPTIKEATYGELRGAFCEDIDGFTESTGVQVDANNHKSFFNYEDSERIDEILAVGYLDNNGSVIDNAHIGDGIFPDERDASHYIDKEAEISETTIKGKELDDSHLGIRTGEVTLFSISEQRAGHYFMAASSHRVYAGVKFNSATKVPFATYYKLRIYVTPKSTDIEEKYASYEGSFGDVRSNAKDFVEVLLPDLPDVMSKKTQIPEIKLTETSDVRVTFELEFINKDFYRDYTVSYFVGNSKKSPKTATDFKSQYRWGDLQYYNNFVNAPFNVVIKDLGIPNFKAQFNGKDKPTLVMSDGRCVAREFEVDDDIKKVSVTRNGKEFKGWQLSLKRASDTSLHIYFPSVVDRLQVGDHFVLTGIEMPDVYIKAAETRLLVAATEYLSKNCETKYTYEPHLDDIYLTRNYDKCEEAGDVTKSVYWNLYAGLRFPFYGIPDTGEESEVLPFVNITIESLTIKEGDNLTPKVELVLNDKIEQSTYQRITTAVDKIYNGSLFANNSGKGGGISMSDVRALISQMVEGKYLSSQSPDTAQELITFLNGIAFKNGGIDGAGRAELLSIITDVLKSYDFNSTTESGFGVTKRKDGKYQLSITDLIVWGKAVFNELEIRKLSYVGGNMVFSSCGSKIKKVVPLDKDGEELSDRAEYFTSGGKLIPANGKFLSYTKKTFRKPSKAFASAGKFIPANGGVLGRFDGDTTDAAAYRCYFHQDDGTTATTNLWEVGDQARCQTFNIKEGKYKGVSNRRYWRLVKKVGEDYIDLSATDCEEGSDVPQVGDALVQFGSRTNTDRMSLIYVVVNGDDAPAIIWYDGVNSYTLKNKRTAIVSPKEVVFNTRMFKLVNDNGEKVTAVAERGEWTQGEEYFYYDRVSHNGRLWLCIAPEGVAVREEPSEYSDKWLLQVDKGDDNIKVDIIVESGAIRNGKGSVTLYGTVYKGGKDITPYITPYRLKWTRMSSDSEADVAWNKAHANIGRRITIQASEVKGGAYINYEFNK